MTHSIRHLIYVIYYLYITALLLYGRTIIINNLVTAQTPTSSYQATQALQWNWDSKSTHHPNVENFDRVGSGWTIPVSPNSTELDLFLTLFNQDSRDLCISETNKYADQTGNAVTKRWAKWTDVTEGEFLQFISIKMLMGINKKIKSVKKPGISVTLVKFRFVWYLVLKFTTHVKIISYNISCLCGF